MLNVIHRQHNNVQDVYYSSLKRFINWHQARFSTLTGQAHARFNNSSGLASFV